MDQLKALLFRWKEREAAMGRGYVPSIVLLRGLIADLEAVLAEPAPVSAVMREGIEAALGPVSLVERESLAMGAEAVAQPVEPPHDEVVERALRAMTFLEGNDVLEDRFIERFKGFPETGKVLVRLKDGFKQYTGVGKTFDEALKQALEIYDAR